MEEIRYFWVVEFIDTHAKQQGVNFCCGVKRLKPGKNLRGGANILGGEEKLKTKDKYRKIRDLSLNACHSYTK